MAETELFYDSITSGPTSTPIRQSGQRTSGYTKPKKQPFSSSASKRSSVMSLGHIDHLQHRFAKGPSISGRHAQQIDSRKSAGSPSRMEKHILEEEIDEREDPSMVPLPPSPIYRKYVRSVSNEIDPIRLAVKLSSDLHDLGKIMVKYKDSTAAGQISQVNEQKLLALASKCIRAARTFSSTIPPYQYVSTRFAVFREEAYEVLSILRQLEQQHRLKETDYSCIQSWKDHLQDYLASKEKPEAHTMTWLDTSLWQPNDTARYFAFLCTYSSEVSLPNPSEDRLGFLRTFATGTTLCNIFNAVVRRSRKPFGLINRYHEDTLIRYRALENLRYWKTALLYRFNLSLEHFSEHEIYAFTNVGQSQLNDALEQFCELAISEMIETVQEESLLHAHRTENGEDDVDELVIGEPCVPL